MGTSRCLEPRPRRSLRIGGCPSAPPSSRSLPAYPPLTPLPVSLCSRTHPCCTSHKFPREGPVWQKRVSPVLLAVMDGGAPLPPVIGLIFTAQNICPTSSASTQPSLSQGSDPPPARDVPGQTVSGFAGLSSANHSLCCWPTGQDPPLLCSTTNDPQVHLCLPHTRDGTVLPSIVINGHKPV